MKKSLWFRIPAILLGGALALWLATRDSELDRFPREQVATVREFLDLQAEVEGILSDSDRTDAEKAAAIDALRPRMEAVAPGIQGMSNRRCLDLRELLHGEDYRLPAYDAAMLACYSRETEPTAADKATKALMDIVMMPHLDQPPAECASALLRYADELEALLQREGLSDEERLEALMLYQERLLNLYIRLWWGEDEGVAVSREVERLLVETPGAVERLEAHAKRLPRTNWMEAEDASDLSVAQDAYAHALQRVLICSLPELMPEGRHHLEQLADFLRAAPQGTRCYLGTIDYRTRDEGVEVELELLPETRPRLPQRAPQRSIRFIPQGNAAEQERLVERLMDMSACLLRCKADELKLTPEGDAELSTRITEADTTSVSGGWRTLQRLFERHPELRERVAGELSPAPAEVQP